MIPSDVAVYVREHAGRLPQRAAVVDGACARRRRRSLQRGALRVPFQKSRPGEDRLVGWQRDLSLRQDDRDDAVLLAAGVGVADPAEPCPVAGAGRWDGLEEGPLGLGPAAAIIGMSGLWQSESGL